MNLPKNNNATSASLIERVKNNDNDAWDELLRLYRLLLVHWINKHQIPEADADDIIQDVWCDVRRQIDAFFLRAGTPSLRPWLRQITSGKIREYFRKNAKRKIVQVESSFFDKREQTEIGGEKEKEEENERVWAAAKEAMGNLISDRDWNIFYQRARTRRSAADIAAEYGVDKGNVRVIIHRVMQKLKKYDGLLD